MSYRSILQAYIHDTTFLRIVQLGCTVRKTLVQTWMYTKELLVYREY